MHGPIKVPREVLDGFQQRYNMKPAFVSSQKALVQLALGILESRMHEDRDGVFSRMPEFKFDIPTMKMVLQRLGEKERARCLRSNVRRRCDGHKT